MKQLNRILSVTLCAIILLSFGVPSVAAQQDMEIIQMDEVVLNEFERLEYMSTRSVEELQYMGISRQEAESIKNFRELMQTHFYELSLLDDDTLLILGYTEEQVAILRDFDGSDQRMQLLSANLTFSPRIHSYTNFTSITLTRVVIAVTWRWNTQPTFLFTDSIVFAWNHNFVFQSNSTISIEYVHRSNPSDIVFGQGSLWLTGLADRGVGFRIPMRPPNGPAFDTHFARSGSFNFTLDRHAQIHPRDFLVYAAYYRTLLSVSLSLSVSSSGPSITVTPGLATSRSAWAQFDGTNRIIRSG